MKAIVTIRLKPNRFRRQGKITGACPLFTPFQRSCTDSEGEHHSYIEEGASLAEIIEKAERKHGHVTRVEAVEP